MFADNTVKSHSSTLGPVFAILLLGFALRLIWALLIPVNPVSDSFAYLTFATNIADHGVYGWAPDQPSAYWAVGPAAIYAGGYLVFGTGSALSVVVLNMMSSMAAIWFIYDLGRRWFGEREGQLAALLFAIWPLTIQFTTVLASELHFIALSLAAIAAWDRSGLDPRGLVYLSLAGVMFAAATYVRPIALLIPAALAMATMIRTLRLSWREALKAVIATVLVIALVAPWSARNERVIGERTFVSTNFWANFWMGNNPDTTGGYEPLPEAVDGMSEVERSHYLKEVSVEHLRAAPLDFVWRTVWKAALLHERETIGVAWNTDAIEALVGTSGATFLKLISTGYWYLMLIAAVIGIVALVRRGDGWRVIVVQPVWLWLYFTGVHAVIVVGDRYHMPAIPMIAMLAAIPLAHFVHRGKA